MPDIRIVARQEGRTAAKEITPLEDSATWSTAAVGGFGDATFGLPGKPQEWRRALPFLSVIQIMYGTEVMWEGQVEDLRLAVSGGDSHTEVQAFGLQRLLSETSIRRVWGKRDIAWAPCSTPPGSTFAGGTVAVAAAGIDAISGNFDPTDPTKIGTQFGGDGTNSVLNLNGAFLEFLIPSGVSISKWVGTQNNVGTDSGTLKWDAVWYALESGTWSLKASSTLAGVASFSVPLTNPTAIRIGVINASGASSILTPGDLMQHYNQRILGATAEDNAGVGFYGGTILRDLIALCPGLTVGLIEDGSDYSIPALERFTRDAMLGVVSEVASYYTREWAVWENGRFDWKDIAPDPEWIIPVAQCQSLTLDGSLDGLARTTYVLYSDAETGFDSEASATTSEQTNPYFKQGRTKDVLAQPGFPMTANTSAQLAAILNAESSKYVPVTGSIVLPAKLMVQSGKGGVEPAYTIRAGQDVVIPDLPRDDLFLPQGRDMQTLFHIASTEVSLPDQTVTIELQGQTKSADVLLARLAATTRVLTG